jgi:hypothetical protein
MAAKYGAPENTMVRKAKKKVQKNKQKKNTTCVFQRAAQDAHPTGLAFVLRFERLQ